MYYEDNDLDNTFEEIIEPCANDNTWDFKSDKSLIQGYGADLCLNDDPSLELKSEWALENNDGDLVQRFQFDQIRYKLVSVQANEMVLDFYDDSLPVGKFNFRIVLSR